MIHEVIPVGPLQCNCSIVGDETSREAIVIDPGDNVEDIMAIVERHGLKVKQIVITHAHIDHVGGAQKLKQRTGAPVLMNENDTALLKLLDVQATWVGMRKPDDVKIDASVTTGDNVGVDGLPIRVLHTPGHTEGSVCLYFEPQKVLLAGDTLFAGSIGRTDLPGGSYEKIIDSIRTTLLNLPEDVVVVPGHGPSTTIGEEKESNPFLKD